MHSRSSFVSTPVVARTVDQGNADAANGHLSWITLKSGSVGIGGFTAFTGYCGNGSGGFAVAYSDRAWYFLALAAA